MRKETLTGFRKRAAEAQARAAMFASPFDGDTPDKRNRRIAEAFWSCEAYNNHYLGHYFRQPPAPFHKELYRAIERERFTVVRAPRGHGKSVILNFSYGSRQAVMNELYYLWLHEPEVFKAREPALYAAIQAEYDRLCEIADAAGEPRPVCNWDPFIQIVAINTEEATAFTEAIKFELEENARLLSDFGQTAGTPGRNYDDFIVKPIDGVGGAGYRYRGTKVKAYGMNKGIRGGRHGPYRPTLILVDDPDSLQTVQSLKVRDKQTKKILGAAKYGLEPKTGRLGLIGTPVHGDCVVCRLTNPQNSEKYKKWHKLQFKAITEDGEPLWPDRFDLEELRDMEREDPEIFAMEMMDTPPTDGDVAFPVLHYYARPAYEGLVRASCLAFDPALGKTSKSDYQALARVNLTKGGDLLISRVERWRMGDYELLIRRLNDVATEEGCDSQVMEAIGFQILMETMLAADSKARQLFLGWNVIEHHSEGKDLRIRSMAPLVRRKVLLFPDDESCIAAERDFRSYPNGKVDVPDVVEMAVRWLRQFGTSKPWQQVRHSARPHTSAMRSGHW